MSTSDRDMAQKREKDECARKWCSWRQTIAIFRDTTFARKFHQSPCGGKSWMSLEGHRDGMVYEHVGVLNTHESYKLMFGYQTRWFGQISKKGLNKCGNSECFVFVSVLHFRGVQVFFQMPFFSYGVLKVSSGHIGDVTSLQVRCRSF